MEHVVIRNLKEWETYGKYGDKPPKKILIRDLSDSHLMRIIQHIGDNPGDFIKETLAMMKEEVKFRTNNFIFVKDYE